MATVIPFLKSDFVFEPEATQSMSAAFDRACQTLKLPSGAVLERENLATRILEWARCGERDPARLCALVLRDAGAA